MNSSWVLNNLGRRRAKLSRRVVATLQCVCVCVCVCVYVCVISVIVKCHVVPSCVVDGHSRNPLYLLLAIN